jgi:hypothetical protein
MRGAFSGVSASGFVGRRAKSVVFARVPGAMRRFQRIYPCGFAWRLATDSTFASEPESLGCGAFRRAAIEDEDGGPAAGHEDVQSEVF